MGLVIEMQLDATVLKLLQHTLDALLDARMIRAIASNEFLNNGVKRCWCELCVWDAHRFSLTDGTSDCGDKTVP